MYRVLVCAFSLFLVSSSFCRTVGLNESCIVVNKRSSKLLSEERLSEAVTTLGEALKAIDDSPNDQLCRALILCNLGAAHHSLGERRLAEEETTASVLLVEKLLGRDSIALRHPFELLVNIAIHKGELKKASQLLDRIEDLPEPSHRDLATIRGLRGILLMLKHKDHEAEAELQKALGERELALETNTTELVSELWTLAVLYLDDHRIHEALNLLDRCSHLLEASNQSADLKIKTFLGLGIAHTTQGNMAVAGDFFERAVDLIPLLPPAVQNPVGTLVYAHYSQFLRKYGQKQKAKEIAQRAEKLYGKGRPGMTVSIDGLRLEKRTWK